MLIMLELKKEMLSEKELSDKEMSYINGGMDCCYVPSFDAPSSGNLLNDIIERRRRERNWHANVMAFSNHEDYRNRSRARLKAMDEEDKICAIAGCFCLASFAGAVLIKKCVDKIKNDY